MIRALIASATLCLLAALPARAIDVQQVTSPGGIHAWLVQDDSIPFVALNFAFKGGASMDPPGKRGAVNLMTATLEEGAGDRDATQFAEETERLGTDYSFAAGDDAVSVAARMLTENRDQAADLLHDALTDPTFSDEAVNRVRAQVEASIRAEHTDPQSLATMEMAKQAWGDHPYATSINGTADSVAGLTRDDLIDAKNRVLARDRVLVSASGDISPEELGQLLDRILGDLPAKATAPLPPAADLQLTGGETVIDWDSPQTIVMFAQQGLPMTDPDYFAAFVLDHVLGGGGFSSRLMNEIREKRGLTYGVSTGLANQVLGQTWQGGMATSNGNARQAVDLVKQIWGDIRGGITQQELDAAKTYLTGEYPLRFDGNVRIATILTSMQLMDMDPDYINTRNSKVEAVTLDDVKRVADRLLDTDKLRFVLVGRPEGM
ncbi:MAG: peptidase M16 [Paracoccus denitrificans]|nr:MAG: peptidase M16 [Paracoccus denitrificans]PZO86297.1 MAG: peptidase M16 [Paracoccus denitrificans]